VASIPRQPGKELATNASSQKRTDYIVPGVHSMSKRRPPLQLGTEGPELHLIASISEELLMHVLVLEEMQPKGFP
jgi:hypothetical protein